MNRETTRSEAEARVGRTLSDKWKLEKLLGMGGMAAVYLATHRNRSRAAVKMLHRSLSTHEPIRRRFLREGYVANTVEHAGAVRVIDDDVDELGDAYLVLELLEGESLDDRWERQGRRLSPREATELGLQLLDVLEAAHQRGIVHRDVKPDNVFLTKSGQLKLLDFGIARLDEGEGSATSTGTGAAMGTPAFMSPEQARGRWELVDGRTDVWAVGASLFTLLTGRPVHQEDTVNETLIAAATKRAPSLVEVAPQRPRCSPPWSIARSPTTAKSAGRAQPRCRRRCGAPSPSSAKVTRRSRSPSRGKRLRRPTPSPSTPRRMARSSPRRTRRPPLARC
jgi:eukaryotic-like serine/threonine-protein kinase